METPVHHPSIAQIHVTESIDLSRDLGGSGQTIVKKSGGRPKSFVWQYYTQDTDTSSSTKRCTVSCNYCEARMPSRVEMMEAHLAHNCPKSPPEVKQHMEERISAAKEASRARKESKERGESVSKVLPGIQQAMAATLPIPPAKRLRIEQPKEHNMLPLRMRFPQVGIRPGHLLSSASSMSSFDAGKTNDSVAAVADF